MARYVKIENGVVTNAVEANQEWADAMGYIPSTDAAPGWTYSNGQFSRPNPTPVTTEQVNAERDRRVQTTFSWNGKAYQLDERSLTRITAMGADARFAKAAGANNSNKKWHGGIEDFGFIATDNSVTSMGVDDVISFSNAAKLWVNNHTMKARALKDMNPIPQNFTDDSYWS